MRTCTLRQLLHGWTTRRLALKTIVVPVAETNVLAVRALVAEGVGGVILFGSEAPVDLPTDLDRLTAAAPRGDPPLVMADEEGGAVQRMANLIGRMPSARTMAATMTATRIQSLARRVGKRMRSTGVTLDLAPVLDLDDGAGPNRDNADGTRSFSIDPAETTRDGLAFARGLLDAGVIPVVKHFPGLGRATSNTDLAPAWTRPWSELQTRGLRPFRAAVLAGMPAVMVSNARVPGLTSRPSALSFAVVHRVLRTQLDFHGLVLTDALSTRAITAAGYGLPGAAVRALRVGNDMVLFNADPGRLPTATRAVVHRIVDAVRSGRLRRARLENAALHVLRTERSRLCDLR